jgi:hypothetical protein
MQLWLQKTTTDKFNAAVANGFHSKLIPAASAFSLDYNIIQCCSNIIDTNCHFSGLPWTNGNWKNKVRNELIGYC